MTRDRFILRYRGSGAIPVQDLERISALHDVNIVDSTSRMVLVDAPFDELEKLIGSVPDWILIPEQNVGLPDPSPKIKKTIKARNKR